MTTHVSLAPDAGRRALAARLAGDDADTARSRAGLSPAGYRQAIGNELSRLARELEARRSGSDAPHDSATLVRYVAGLTTPESDPGLEEHLEACTSCQSFVEDLRARAWARVSELEAAAAAPAAARAATDPVLGGDFPAGAPLARMPERPLPIQETLAPPKVRVLASAPTAADLTMPVEPTPWWKQRGAIVGGAVALLLLVGGGTAFALTSGGGESGPTAEQLAAQRAAAAKREAASRDAAVAALGQRSTAQQVVLDRQAKERAAAAAAARKRREAAAEKRREARERREAARKRREARARAAAAATPAASSPAPARASSPPPAASTPAPAPSPSPSPSRSGGAHTSGPMDQRGGWGS